MNEGGKSDSPVLPAKPSNKAGAAETVEERGLTKGNTDSTTGSGHRAGKRLPQGLERVRQAAKQDRTARFTALLHHVDIDCLRQAYLAINPKAAAGVDEVTWKAYGEDLEANLQDLHRRVHSGAYRAKPVRRTYIPKADGRQRPLGIASLEDKIVRVDPRQRTVAEMEDAERLVNGGEEVRPVAHCSQNGSNGARRAPGTEQVEQSGEVAFGVRIFDPSNAWHRHGPVWARLGPSFRLAASWEPWMRWWSSRWPGRGWPAVPPVQRVGCLGDFSRESRLQPARTHPDRSRAQPRA
jgi:hypothetical protein